MIINIRSIRINVITNIGSLNVGKVIISGNQSSYIQFPKEGYEEIEEDDHSATSVEGAIAVAACPPIIDSAPWDQKE